jgi:tRNA threonylcarbamoyladenosine biosynthesis protein TsaE
MEICVKANDLRALAEAVPAIVSAINYPVVLVNGEMGAGKTTLISALCKYLGVEASDLSSPTFSLVNEYSDAAAKPIYHFDCYRLKDEEEAFHAGLEEYFFSGYPCWIEWPDKIRNLLPSQWSELTISLGPQLERIIHITNQHV